MSEFHELTEKIWESHVFSKKVGIDKVITSYLTQKAEEAFNKAMSKNFNRVAFLEILGLSPLKDAECEHIVKGIEKGILVEEVRMKPLEPSVPGREYWCSHIEYIGGDKWTINAGRGEDLSYWIACPWCGKPRPENRGALELWEVLVEMSTIRGDASCGASYEQKAKTVADAAIKWFISLVDELKGNGFAVDVSALKSELAKGGGA